MYQVKHIKQDYIQHKMVGKDLGEAMIAFGVAIAKVEADEDTTVKSIVVDKFCEDHNQFVDTWDNPNYVEEENNEE